jgi:GTPase SAR1 family protein
MLDICLLGDSSVGKTTALLTYKNEQYTPSENPTVGTMKIRIVKDDINVNVTQSIFLIFKS